VSVRGHPFERDAFSRMFESMDGIAGVMVDQPAAAQLMNPDGMAPYDALVLYDMPGLDFTSAKAPPAFVDPPKDLQCSLRALLEQGKAVVALHHALAGRPTWDEYGDWLGGRFLYRPARVRGEMRLDSGYARAVAQEFETLVAHPVRKGLPPRFSLTDEPYLCEVFERDIRPLLRSSASFQREDFFSAAAAVAGRMEDNSGWEHPPGSNAIAWTKRALNSPLVYIQPGDVGTTFENRNYRRLVENAIRWTIAESRRH
jgi:hypothetical protein